MSSEEVNQTSAEPFRSRPVVNKAGCSVTTYGNPWDTFESVGFGRILSWKLFGEKRMAKFPTPEEAAVILPSVPIDKQTLFRYAQGPSSGSPANPVASAPGAVSTESPPTKPDAMTCTWCGHSAFVVQQGGVSILTDPVWADRCSPMSFIGPKRMVPLPILIPDLCPIDIVTISHNHYDHLDTAAVQALIDCFDPIFVVPLGMKANSLKAVLSGKGVDGGRFVELNWWEEVLLVREAEAVDTDGDPTKPTKRRRMLVHREPYEVPTVTAESELEASGAIRAAAQANNSPVAVRVAGVPVQHWAMRTGFDRNYELWCGFVARISTVSPFDSAVSTSSMFHCGDTGYCVSFKEIGNVFSQGVDLGLIPIGAYNPRNVMKAQHVDPAEAVLIHEDIKSRYSIGMHWGTFILTDEAVDEPPKKLAEEMERREKEGKPLPPFVAQKHGESSVIPISSKTVKFV